MQNIDTDPPGYLVGSLDSALRLLLEFRLTQSLSVSEAAHHLGVAKSTAHRLLDTLKYRGFVIQDSERRYRVGTSLRELAVLASPPIDVRLHARPFIEDLSATTGETVHLLVLRGTQVLFVDSVEGTQSVRIGSRVGWSTFAHTTSGGKALLAQYTTEQLRLIYPRDDLPRMTHASIGDFDTLVRELRSVRELGYATSVQETSDGVASVAVAVTSSDALHRVALTVSMPDNRASPERLVHIASLAGVAATGLRLVLQP